MLDRNSRVKSASTLRSSNSKAYLENSNRYLKQKCHRHLYHYLTNIVYICVFVYVYIYNPLRHFRTNHARHTSGPENQYSANAQNKGANYNSHTIFSKQNQNGIAASERNKRIGHTLNGKFFSPM